MFITNIHTAWHNEMSYLNIRNKSVSRILLPCSKEWKNFSLLFILYLLNLCQSRNLIVLVLGINLSQVNGSKEGEVTFFSFLQKVNFFQLKNIVSFTISIFVLKKTFFICDYFSGILDLLRRLLKLKNWKFVSNFMIALCKQIKKYFSV